jgi:TetR/AcrR family acrAB operon transcriptional repressor
VVRKTKQEAQETRNLILDTAEMVFLEKGVSRTSLNDIAKTAGLTRGAIYWHFKNKADLFDAIMDRAILPMEEFDCKCKTPTANPLDFIKKSAMKVMETLVHEERTRNAFEIMMFKLELVDDMLPVRDRHINCRESCITDAQIRFQDAIDKQLLPSITNARLAAIGLHSLIDGLIANWVLAPKEFDLIEQAQFSIQCYLKGLNIPNNENGT